jgi:hypothetical protein
MIIFEMPQASSELMEVAALALALPEGAKGAGLTKKPDDKKAGKEEKKKNEILTGIAVSAAKHTTH